MSIDKCRSFLLIIFWFVFFFHLTLHFSHSTLSTLCTLCPPNLACNLVWFMFLVYMAQYIVLSLLWFCKATTGHVRDQPGLNNKKLQEFLSAASVCRILGRRSLTVSIRNDNSLSAFFSHKWLLRIHWCPVKMLMLILLLL